MTKNKKLVLEIPKQKKTYKWDFDKGRHVRTIVSRYSGDEGLEMNGRVYTYHPTKGWRSRFIPVSIKDYAEAPGIIQWLRTIFQRRGLA